MLNQKDNSNIRLMKHRPTYQYKTSNNQFGMIEEKKEIRKKERKKEKKKKERKRKKELKKLNKK